MDSISVGKLIKNKVKESYSIRIIGGPEILFKEIDPKGMEGLL